MPRQLIHPVGEIHCERGAATESNDVDVVVAIGRVQVELMERLVYARVSTGTRDTAKHLAKGAEPRPNSFPIKTVLGVCASEPEDVGVVFRARFIGIPGSVECVKCHRLSFSTSAGDSTRSTNLRSHAAAPWLHRSAANIRVSAAHRHK